MVFVVNSFKLETWKAIQRKPKPVIVREYGAFNGGNTERYCDKGPSRVVAASKAKNAQYD